MEGLVSAFIYIVVIVYSIITFKNIFFNQNSKSLSGSMYDKALPQGMEGNNANAKILTNKPNPSDPMMLSNIQSGNLGNNMAIRGAKAIAGLGILGGALPIAIAKGMAGVGTKAISSGAKKVDDKLGATRRIKGAQWFIRGMKYKVADKVSYAKNSIANSMVGKQVGRVIKGVKKLTKPVVDVAKDGVTLVASGLNGVSFKAQKDQYAKMQQLKKEARARNRKISQIKRSAYESVNEDLKSHKKQIQDEFSNYRGDRRRRIRTYTDKVIADREIAYQRERKNQAIKDLDKYYDRNLSYNNRVQTALEKAELRGYNKGTSGLTKIATIATSGTAGFILGNLRGKKSNLAQYTSGSYSNTRPMVVNVYENNTRVNNNLRINDIMAENTTKVVSTKLQPTVNTAVKMDQLKDAIKIAKDNNLTLKQGIRYADLEEKAEYTRAQQIEDGNRKPLNVEEMKKYFASAIKHGNDVSTEEMFNAIQDAEKKQKEDYFKLENRARKQADFSTDVNKEAKEALENILNNSSETREIFERVLAENNRLSDSKIEKIEKQVDKADDEVNKLRTVELEGTIEDMTPKIVDEVIKAVKNSEHSEKAKELLGEESYFQFEKSVRQILQNNEEDFARRMEKVNNRLDQEFVKANASIHPEYSELGKADLRSLRQENDRGRYVERALNKQRVQNNQEFASDNPIVSNLRTHWRENASVIRGRGSTRSRFNNNITGDAV